MAIIIKDFNNSVVLNNPEVVVNNRFKLKDGVYNSFTIKNNIITEATLRPVAQYTYPLIGTLTSSQQGGYEKSDFKDIFGKSFFVQVYRALYWLLWTLPTMTLKQVWYWVTYVIREGLVMLKFLVWTIPSWIWVNLIWEPIVFIFYEVLWGKLIKPIWDDLTQNIIYGTIPLIMRLFGDLTSALIDWYDVYVKSGQMNRDLDNLTLNVKKAINTEQIGSILTGTLGGISTIIASIPDIWNTYIVKFFGNSWGALVNALNGGVGGFDKFINDLVVNLGAYVSTLIKFITEAWDKIAMIVHIALPDFI